MFAGTVKVGFAKGDTRAPWRALFTQPALPLAAAHPPTLTLCTEPDEPNVIVALEGSVAPATHAFAAGSTERTAACALPCEGWSGRLPLIAPDAGFESSCGAGCDSFAPPAFRISSSSVPTLLPFSSGAAGAGFASLPATTAADGAGP